MQKSTPKGALKGALGNRGVEALWNLVCALRGAPQGDHIGTKSQSIHQSPEHPHQHFLGCPFFPQNYLWSALRDFSPEHCSSMADESQVFLPNTPLWRTSKKLRLVEEMQPSGLVFEEMLTSGLVRTRVCVCARVHVRVGVVCVCVLCVVCCVLCVVCCVLCVCVCVVCVLCVCVLCVCVLCVCVLCVCVVCVCVLCVCVCFVLCGVATLEKKELSLAKSRTEICHSLWPLGFSEMM